MSIRSKLSIVLFALFLFACNPSNREHGLSKDSLLHLDSSKKTSLNDESNWKVNFVYHMVFDSSKDVRKNLAEGWLDTFSIDNQHFRLRLDTGAIKNYYAVEQQKGSGWVKLFSPSIGEDEYARMDVDKDGYMDFVRFYHSLDYIYFYDPIKKTITNDCYTMPETTENINKTIFFNYYEAMYSNAYESSLLYTYKNQKPFFYYKLLFIDDDNSNYKKMNLYKLKNGVYDDTVFVKTIASGDNIKFDYESYWKAHYKELMVAGE
ncbi:MAG: hypothetical protein J0I41_04975 [Filimonas sp.]|nr:hypothetical protein [Filimonas sp.]